MSISINSGAASTNSAASTLTLSSTDATSGIFQMQFSCDNSTYSSLQAYAVSATWNLVTGSGCTTSQGNKTVFVRFRDVAGNTSSPISGTIVYDTLPPTTTGSITAGTLGNNANYTTSVTFSITPTDSTTGVASTQYCSDIANICTPNINYTTPITLSTESQSNYVRFTSTDNVGNIQMIQSSGPIKIDLTDPVTSANNASASFYTTNPSITLTSSDGGS